MLPRFERVPVFLFTDRELVYTISQFLETNLDACYFFRATMNIKTTIHLWKIRRDLAKADRRYYRTLRESGKKEDDCTGEPWYAEWMFANISAEAEERKAISDGLVSQARQLYLPSPPLDNGENWDSDGGIPPTRYLSERAMTELRSAIRKERMERRAVIEWWFKVVGGAVGILTGLVGALIGLLAVWKK
jgi:hypothetical protein